LGRDAVLDLTTALLLVSSQLVWLHIQKRAVVVRQLEENVLGVFVIKVRPAANLSD